MEFPTDELVFTSTKTQSDLKKVLKFQDFGLMAYFLPTNSNEELLGKMVLAVKTAEYLAAGLPMICNGYCGGAARIIQDNKLGIVYFPENINSLTKEDILLYLNQSARQDCQTFALNNFDYSMNARRYKLAYSEVLK
jgi:glycosyltransferase involved in cell wall biosynthesis